MNSYCKTEKIHSHDYIGIDVSKAHLDFAIENCKVRRVTNTPEGLRELLGKISILPDPCVICEATGGYERKLVNAMLAAGIKVAVAPPGRVKHLARASGTIAKTDAMDAVLIQRFGQTIPLPLEIPPHPDSIKLRQITDFRKTLSDDIVKTSNRLEHAEGYLREQLEAQLKHLKAHMKKTEADMHRHILASDSLAAKFKRVQELKGCGPVLASTLLALLPELGKTSDKTICSIVGVAPHLQDSGKHVGKAFIRGGRLQIRHVLYMAAVTAIRCNPILSAFYKRLRTQSGKPAKIALVAVMRKMLCVINKLVTDPKFSLAG